MAATARLLAEYGAVLAPFAGEADAVGLGAGVAFAAVVDFLECFFVGDARRFGGRAWRRICGSNQRFVVDLAARVSCLTSRCASGRQFWGLIPTER